MSRSTQLLKELPFGESLVAITEIKKQGENLLVKFSSGQNKSTQHLYDYTSKEFIKMCNDADTMEENYLIHNEESLGKRLVVTIDENNGAVIETSPYVKNQLPDDKKKIIDEQRAMIAKVESSDEFDIM